MEARYIITIGKDEEPQCVSKELDSGTVTTLITARTPQEAVQLFHMIPTAAKKIFV